MNVKIEIFSKCGEEENFYPSQGTLTLGRGGFCAEYQLSGDGCTLSWDGKTLTQRRQGEICLDMRFVEGQETDCSLSEGGGTFPFTVRTTVLGASFGEEGCTVTLEYFRAGEESPAELIFRAERVRGPNERREPKHPRP